MTLRKSNLLLIKKAAKLYKLWIKAEAARKKVNRLMANGTDCFSAEMLSAFDEFHSTEEQWKAFKKEYAQAKREI